MNTRIWAVLVVLLTAPVIGQCKVILLSSSIFLFGPEDYILHGNSSRCTQMVDRAAKEINSRLNFVPTLFWVDKKSSSSRPVTTVSYFSYQRVTQPDGTITCKPASQTDIDTFQHSMQACFARAIEYNMSLQITPQLNDGTVQAAWQNLLNFDPLLDYEEFSYMDVMLSPLAHAVNAVVKAKTKVYFALQGQMGATLFNHPMQYMQAAGTLHHQLHNRVPKHWPEFVQFGISLNFNKLCGCVLTDTQDSATYMQQFPAAFKGIKHHFDFLLLQELFDRIDFVSISGLAPLSPTFSPGDLQTTVEWFAEELAEFGIDLHERLVDGTLALHWSDVGLGGGSSPKGNIATTAAETAEHPSWGFVGQYEQATDPWVLHAINTTESPVRSFLSLFYNQTTEYLWKQHEFKYQIDAAYLRNYGSWDVQGIYPDSTSGDGSYYYPSVAHVIRHHNWRSQRLTNLAETLGEAGIKFLIDSRMMQYREPVLTVPKKASAHISQAKALRVF